MAAKQKPFVPQDITFSASSNFELQAVADNSPPTFSLLAYRGGSLTLSNFRDPAYIDLATASLHGGDGSQQPVLLEHDNNRPVGHGTPVIDSDKMRVEEGVISHDNAASKEVITASRNKFRYQSSVGGKMTQRPLKLQRGQSKSVNGRTIHGPAMIVKGFVWRETSLTAQGADDEKAVARIAASKKPDPSQGSITMDFNDWLLEAGFVADDLSADQTKTLQAAFDKENVPEPEPIKAAVAMLDPDDDIKAHRDRVRAAHLEETNRLGEIDRIKAAYDSRVPDTAMMTKLVNAAINGESTATELELELLKASRDEVPSGVHAHIVQSHKAGPMAIEAALLQSSGFSEDQAVESVRRQGTQEEVEVALNAANSLDMRGFGLHQLLFASLEASGQHVSATRVNNDVIRAAFHIAETEIKAASGFSTISLPGILGRVQNSAMLTAYNDVPSAIREIASTTSSADFKQIDRHRMTEEGSFEKVPASGEISHGSLSEETTSNRVETYGRRYAITRTMFINDDLSAMMQIPRILGRQSAAALEETGHRVLTSLPTAVGAGTVADFFRGAALKNAQPNYMSGPTSALDINSLSDAYGLFLQQTDSSGKPVLVEPAILFTTTQNAVLARSLYNSTEVRIAGTDERTRMADNERKGMFKPVASAYLGLAAFNPDGATNITQQWFLTSAPTEDFGVIQIAYLRGATSPTIETADIDWSQLGMGMRGYFDFGFGPNGFDPRCAVKAAGA